MHRRVFRPHAAQPQFPPQGSEFSLNHIERDQRVSRDERGVFFPPTPVFIGPGTVGVLQVDELQRQLLAPIDAPPICGLQPVCAIDAQGLGHRMIVVIQSLGSQSGILINGEIGTQLVLVSMAGK